MYLEKIKDFVYQLLYVPVTTLSFNCMITYHFSSQKSCFIDMYVLNSYLTCMMLKIETLYYYSLFM